MATFYIFPSRHLLGQRFSVALASLFPGKRHSPWDWPDLAESLSALVTAQGNACVVYREDIDESLNLRDALTLHFGASADDEIIEVHFPLGMTKAHYQHWETSSCRLEYSPPFMAGSTATPP